MKTYKKILVIVLIIFMVLGSYPVSTLAASTKNKVKSIKVTSTPANILVVKKGQKYKLKVRVKGEGKFSKKVRYSSANESIATVSSSGRVKGIRKGSTKIIVKSTVNPKVKKTIKVKVGTPVKKVKVTKKKVTLNEGETYKIKVKLSPKKPTYKKVSFTSSDKTVVKVSKKGKVTALKAGKAVITVKSRDGSNKKAKVIITVKGDGNSEEATADPEASPTGEPSATPSEEPTLDPQATPTEEPTSGPEVTPTAEPTATSEVVPTSVPSATPTRVPTAAPTSTPTKTPTSTPTKTPTPKPSATPTSNPDFIHKKFDLGGNGTANGYIGVSASEVYDKAKGYGFNQKSLVQDLDALGEGALSDAVHFRDADGCFMVDLPKGVYRITVITGRDECSNIVAEDNIQLLNLIGNNAKDSFTIPVTDGCLNIRAAAGGSGRHSLCSIEIEQTSNDTATKPTIWICGDSTAASYYNTSEKSKRGWGEYLHNYVDMDKYDVRNISIKSSESLQDLVDNYFKTIEKLGKNGDILVLAHGIKDYTDAYAANSNSPDSAAYVKNMTNLVRQGKQNGMKIYLVKQHCNLKTNFQYPLVKKMWFSDELDSIAASEKVNVLDMFHAWRDFCLQKGRVLADTYYNEDFYLNKYGADKMAELASELLFSSGEQGGPSIIDPYPDFDSSTAYTYESVISGEIITNPHKGYVMEVHSKDMLYSGRHRLGIDGSDGNKAWDVISTCCSVLYWKNINPAEGKYDFSEIDTMLEACEQAGMTYAIRIIPYSTGTGSDADYGATHDFVPQWVYKKGAKKNRTKYKWRDSSVQIDVPDWSDPVYIQAYKDLLAALAKKYDNDPRVEYIENRAFGNMGEWHTGEFDNNFMPSVEIQKDMLDYYAKTFKNTTCSVFVDAREVYDYANSLGFAKRNDGFILEPNTEWTLVPSYKANVPTMADNHNTYEYMLNPDDSAYLPWSEQHYRECIEISHLTFMAIDQDSGCGYRIYREHQDLIDEMCNKIGYNFTVTSAERKGNKLKVKVKNIGLAPAFFDIDLCAEITDSNGNKIKTFGEPVHIGKGTFHDGDERAFMFEYNGTFDESSTICLAMYESSKYKSTSELINSNNDPTIRFDNKNNLKNKRLKLVKK